MKPERWKQVDELLEAALDCPATERASFLDRVCSGDEELRHELESLLISDGQAGFIESPPARVAADLLTENQPKPSIGQRIAHYEVLSQIGSGGMGEVYLARDIGLGRKVALKLLPASLTADAQLRARFFREAQLASALDHPNICTIHEVGQASSFLFIAMQYVEGVTLKQIIGSRPLKLDALLSISLQAADALAAAHDQGIIHRDIKSNNIIITPRGQLKVLDFGLAKLMYGSGRKAESELTSQLTKTGAVMGTPSYMSPEQARGEGVDHRSDIFSFGVVIYEMASGAVPFKRRSHAETMNAVINEPHTPVIELNQEVPAGLSAAIDRALSKDPANRYQSMGEMLLDLRQVGRGIGLLGASDSQGAVIPYVPLGKRAAKHWMWAVTLLGLALLVGLGLWVSSLQLRRGTSSLLAGDIKSLAVLPLENLSGDPSQEYFADGMTDALIGDLAKIRGLQVISRTSAMHYKGANKPLKEIASELKVDAILEGTVQRSGDRVQVRAQLIQAATDRHLWAETYERDLRDVLALQSEIAGAVVREIQIKIMPAERARLAPNRPVNRKALDDYLQGRFLFWNRRTDENLYKAISFFQSSVKEDPGYAPAYVGLADCYNFLGTVQIGSLPPMDARRQAEEAARKALEIDNEMAEAHVALGFVKQYNWDWAAAEQELKLAIELNPNYAFAHDRYGSFLSSLGRAEEAIAEANRAQELDPLSLAISAQRGYILENARRYDEAIEQLRRVIEMDQYNFYAYWLLGHTYAVSGRFAESIQSCEKAAALSRTPGALGILGMCYGFAGRTGEANKILDELLELNRHRYVPTAAMANVYVGLGNKDQAFFWLEKAYQERSNYMAYLKVLPFLDSLRGDPRFDDLLQRIGLAS